jgi:CheY-like chemotaxis protein
MPQGGKLLYATRITDLQEAFCRRFSDSAQPGKYIQVDIVDTGTGMDDATRKRIFEPFFTTKELGKGTGMGLAAVYGTIKNHGGIVSLKSTVDEGTTMTVYLPQAKGADEEQAASVATKEATKGSANVLLVDDDPSVQLTGSKMLEALGYEVTVCANGREGLDHFRDHWQAIDIVLLDMIMPEMNGEETFAAMQEISPDVVVLIVSGYSLDEKAQRMVDTGAAGFMQKPFRMATLATYVSDALTN